MVEYLSNNTNGDGRTFSL